VRWEDLEGGNLDVLEDYLALLVFEFDSVGGSLSTNLRSCRTIAYLGMGISFNIESNLGASMRSVRKCPTK
jgi:hypothetical protein